MSRHSVEERLTALEKRVDELLSDQQKSLVEKDWRRTIGAFTDDDVMKAIFEEGRKIRQAERDRARDPRKKRTKAP
jgi:hypothetical protein